MHAVALCSGVRLIAITKLFYFQFFLVGSDGFCSRARRAEGKEVMHRLMFSPTGGLTLVLDDWPGLLVRAHI